MWWHISESIRTSVHLSPRAQFQPQDCWSFSAKNWFPASYFICYIFLLPDHCGSALAFSDVLMYCICAVCVLLCFYPAPPHRPFVGSLSGLLLSFSHSWIEKYSKYIWYAALFLFGILPKSVSNLKLLLQISFCRRWCYVTSNLHVKVKGWLFLQGVKQTKWNASLRWKLGFRLRVKISFGIVSPSSSVLLSMVVSPSRGVLSPSPPSLSYSVTSG